MPVLKPVGKNQKLISRKSAKRIKLINNMELVVAPDINYKEHVIEVTETVEKVKYCIPYSSILYIEEGVVICYSTSKDIGTQYVYYFSTRDGKDEFNEHFGIEPYDTTLTF